MRVLYVDGVGPFGGASRSLSEVISAMPPRDIEALFLAVRGTAVPHYRRLAADMVVTRGLTRFDNTRYSYYRGLRWLVVLRELAYFPFTLFGILRAKVRWGRVDVVHANEVTEVIPAWIAAWVFRAPLVLHVRSLARVNRASLRCRWLNARLKSAAAVIAIDENVRATLPADLGVDVIHNAFSASRPEVRDETLALKLKAVRPDALKVGFVGNLHHSKGIFDLLEAARLLSERGACVEFLVVGGSTGRQRGLAGWLLERAGLAQDVEAEVRARVARYRLGTIFHLLGPSINIRQAYDAMDVLCFPSHFDAPGRPVFEAAFSGVPSIVAVSEPRADTLIAGETGLAVREREPKMLAEALMYFVNNPTEVHRMGENARKLAEQHCDPRSNAMDLWEVYARVVRQRGATA